MRRLRVLLPVTAAVLAVACSSPTPFEVNGLPAQSYSLAVGGRIDILVGTTGPGKYISPPTLNGASIQFLDVTTPDGIVTPGGVQQLFHFKGIAAGRTIIILHNENLSGLIHADVIDTIVVR